MSEITSALVCSVRFANSFTRCLCGNTSWRQIVFSVVYCSFVPITILPKMWSFNLLVLVITSSKLHQNTFNILAKWKKYRWHETDTKTDIARIISLRIIIIIVPGQ